MKSLEQLVKAWQSYQDTGTPYGNTFEGFIEWLRDKMIRGDKL